MILPQHKLEGGRKQVYHMKAILEIQDLHVSYRSSGSGLCPALTGVSFGLMPGEIMGVLGESGSGKSTLAGSLVRLLPANARITRGAVQFEGTDLLRANADELRQIRSRSISKSERKTGSRDDLHHTQSSSALWLCRSCACSLRREGR